MWLYVGFVGPLLGIGLLFLSGWMWNVVGWFVSIAFGMGMLVVFTGADLKRRANPWYLAQPGLVAGLRLAVAVASIVVAGIHAYLLADYIARLDVWVP